MKRGPKSPDHEVAAEIWIDEEIISEKEFGLIETVIIDIIPDNARAE